MNAFGPSKNSVPVISTILFDLDNTLIPTREADRCTCAKVATWLETQGMTTEESREITNHYNQQFRRAPAPDYPTDQFGLDNWRRAIWEAVLPEDYKNIDKVYSYWKLERLNQLSLKPCVKELLKELAKDFNLGLITNGPSVAQWEKIKEIGCEKYFDSIIVSGDLAVEKPSKDIYDIACKELQVSPAECIMVGDKIETDIWGGVNAGVKATVWIKAKNCQDSHTIKPDFTIEHVMELPDILHKLSTVSQIC